MIRVLTVNLICAKQLTKGSIQNGKAWPICLKENLCCASYSKLRHKK